MLSINQNTSQAEYMIYPTMLTSTITFKGNPDVAIDANNRPHIVWDDTRNSISEFVFIIDGSGSMGTEWGDMCVALWGGNFASGGYTPGLIPMLDSTGVNILTTLYLLYDTYMMFLHEITT